MGLLDALGRGISAAGYAASNVGLEGVKATLEQEKIKLADELAGRREEARDTRAEKAKIDAEERGIVNIPRTAKATADAAVANAPALRQVRIDDALAVHKAQLNFDTDPANVEKKAAAEAAKDKFLKSAAADTAAALLQKPDYLKNLQAIALAEHPERAAQIAASLASAAKSQFELGQQKLLAAAKKELADAGTNPDAVKAAKAKVSALEWSVGSDRAQQAADSAVMRSLQERIKTEETTANNIATDPATKAQAQKALTNLTATYDAMLGEYTKTRGIEVKPPEPGTPPPQAIDFLKKNPQTAEDFRKKYGADPSKYLTPTKGSPGVLSTPRPFAGIQVPDSRRYEIPSSLVR